MYTHIAYTHNVVYPTLGIYVFASITCILYTSNKNFLERGRKSVGLWFYFRAPRTRKLLPSSFFSMIIIVVLRRTRREYNIHSNNNKIKRLSVRRQHCRRSYLEQYSHLARGLYDNEWVYYIHIRSV